jgi:nitroreductase
MNQRIPDDYTVHAALALAVRAPSVHNSQPWRWRIIGRTVHLYADYDRQLSETDPDGRDLLLSCGAALHHLRVGFGALGWHAEVHRLPDSADPDHLAAVELHPREPGQDEIMLAAAIPRRRTDRRHHSLWPVPRAHVELMAARAADEGVVLRTTDDPYARYHLTEAIAEAARVHAADAAYRVELDAWSGRRESLEGVPAINVPEPDEDPGALPVRPFSDPQLAQPSGSSAESTATVLLVMATASDDRMSRLRAGEATSAALLTATSLGLASCPLTEPLELRDTRELVRSRVTAGSFPQMVLRVGWAPINAEPLPATPRLPLTEVVPDLAGSS